MAWLTADDLTRFDVGLGDDQKYGADVVAAVIADAEATIERIVGVAYDRRTVSDEWHLGDGGCWLRLDQRWPVSVSAASIGGTAVTVGNLTVDRRTGSVYLSSGWTCGQEILVSYVHGHFTTTEVDDVTTYVAAPPADLLRAAKILCRALLAEQVSPVIDRSTFYAADGGGMFRLAQPTATTTGVPAVDGVLARYLVPGIA